MKLLTFAHHGEAQHFLRNDDFRPVKFQFDGLFKNEKNYLLLTGEGLETTHKRIESVLKNIENEISEVINFGIAGALVEDIELDSIHYVKQIKKENEIKNYQIQNTKKGLDCISALHRVQDINYRNRLKSEAQIVDCELWAIADVCSIYKLPVFSIKLISDYAGQATDTKRIIQKAKKYSKNLYEFYNSNTEF